MRRCAPFTYEFTYSSPLAEPALLVFKGTDYHMGWVQSVPFARPALDDVVSSIEFVEKKDYPPRGTR